MKNIIKKLCFEILPIRPIAGVAFFPPSSLSGAGGLVSNCFCFCLFSSADCWRDFCEPHHKNVAAAKKRDSNPSFSYGTKL